MRPSHILFLTIIFSVTGDTAFARSAVCPSAKNILTSKNPGGQFAKSMWQLIDAKTHQIDISDSVLVFSGEKVKAERTRLRGYFWWRRDHVGIGCAKVEGSYVPSTRKLLMRTLKVSSPSIPARAWYSATLSDDGNTLLKFKITGDDQDMLFHWFFRYGNGAGGKWQATKIFPLEAEKASNITKKDQSD